MIAFPNAKINIGLNIKEKRKDGFHNIETVFYPVELSDILEIQENREKTGIQLTNTGIYIDSVPENNLCYKAYKQIKKNIVIPDVNIHLHKCIPYGSGLGGGSSDAAFTLKMLNTIFNLNLPEKKLYETAGKIGSDCPFFLRNSPSFAYDRGDQLAPIQINLKGYYLILIVPNIHISSKVAYQGVIAYNKESSLKDKIMHLDVEKWKDHIKNDFETHIFKLYPKLGDIKETLYRHNAVYASLSGSGSAVYGLFRKKPKNEIQIRGAFKWEKEL